MDLKEYLSILWRRKWVILVTTITTLGVVFLGTYLTAPIYSASSTLRIATASGQSVTYTDYMYADRLMNTYVKIATSSPVLAELANKIGISQSPKVKVETIPNTELIKVSVESTDPQLAQVAANFLADILVAQAKELYSGGEKSPQQILNDQLTVAEGELKQARQNYENLVIKSPEATDEIDEANRLISLREKTYEAILEQYEQARLRESLQSNLISVVEPATLPTIPVRPQKIVNLGLGLIIGLCGGIGLAFLFENFSSRLYSSHQIESITGMSVLSKIPRADQELTSDPIIREIPPNAPFQEAFRRLRTNILINSVNGSEGRIPDSIMIASAERGEGKSAIAVHLAATMLQVGLKVVLIDADLRVPTIHRYLDLPNEVGLSSLLQQTSEIEEVLQASHPIGLSVITSGPIPANPTELLGSSRMKELIEALKHDFDLIIIDTPAFLPVADTAVLAPLVDGILLIVRRNYISEEAIREMCDQLEKIKTRKIGVVVNEAESNTSYYYYKK